MRAHLKSADYLMSITISSISTDIGGMFRELWANWAFETSFFYIFLQEVIMNRKSCNLIFSKAQRPKGYPLLPVSADQNKMILAKLVTFDTLFYCSRFSFSPSYITNLPFNFTPQKNNQYYRTPVQWSDCDSHYFQGIPEVLDFPLDQGRPKINSSKKKLESFLTIRKNCQSTTHHPNAPPPPHTHIQRSPSKPHLCNLRLA